MDERYGGIYSGTVTFFRGPESEGSRLEEKPYNIPVISVAALSGPRIGSDGLMYPEETEGTLEKMRTIFHIAKLFHQVIEEPEFKNKFRLIDFAILDGYQTGMSHNPEGNLLPFRREFEGR